MHIQNFLKEETMRKQFWKRVGWGVFWTLLVLLVIGGSWAIKRDEYVTQTRIQATYLAELSGYEIRGISNKTFLTAKSLAEFTEKTVADSENPEQELLNWLIFLNTDGSRENGSYVIELIVDYPEAVNLALAGEVSSAQKLQEKWYRTRHIGFLWYGMTLTLIFLIGMVITLIVASEFLTHEFKEMKENRDGYMESFERSEAKLDALKKEIKENPPPKDDPE